MFEVNILILVPIKTALSWAMVEHRGNWVIYNMGCFTFGQRPGIPGILSCTHFLGSCQGAFNQWWCGIAGTLVRKTGQSRPRCRGIGRTLIIPTRISHSPSRSRLSPVLLWTSQWPHSLLFFQWQGMQETVHHHWRCCSLERKGASVWGHSFWEPWVPRLQCCSQLVSTRCLNSWSMGAVFMPTFSTSVAS